jgi:HAD superfamily hydrolase (TIGR01509 family)
MLPKVVIFGSIGTLTETSEMQRAAFNQAFADAGLAWSWDENEYRQMVQAGGAKGGGSERVADYAKSQGEDLSDVIIAHIHKKKTSIFQAMMAKQGLSPNAGVIDLIADARAHDIHVVIASTTFPESISAMLSATSPMLSAEMFDLILTGDDVTRIKPASDIYNLVLARLAIDAVDAIAIEDTATSLPAPLNAGIPTIVVPGFIAQGVDFGDIPVLESLAFVNGVQGLMNFANQK